MERPFTAYEGDEPFIFVCYAHEDRELVYPEIERLRQVGFRIWYDEGITPGSEWSEILASHIKRSAAFLYFITPAGVASEHCRREVSFALEQSRELVAVHLQQSRLPDGLRLSLSHKQAILKYEHATPSYERKLDAALRRALAGQGAASAPAGSVVRLGDWTLDLATHRLTRHDEQHVLDPKQLSVLLHLADRAPDVVPAEGLLARTWPGVVVGDNVVHQAIAHLRKTLGDNARAPRYIETLPRRGYRLMVPVVAGETATGTAADDAATVAAPLARSRRGRAGRLAAIAAGVVLIAAASAWLLRFGSEASHLQDQRLVVQHLANQSDRTPLDHVAAGLRDELIHRLSRIPTLVVSETDPGSGAYVLGGSLRPAGTGVRITLRLADERDRTIWSHHYDVAAEATVAAQVDVAIRVARAVNVLMPHQRGLARGSAGTTDPDARLAFLRAVAATASLELPDLRMGLSYLEQALRIDPDFALAWAMKAHIYQQLANYLAMEQSEAAAHMRVARDRALALDAELPLALYVDAQLKLYDGEFQAAEAAVQRALARHPPVALYQGFAHYFATCGRTEEALNLIDRAIEADPVSGHEPMKVQILWYARRWEEALALSEQILSTSPDDRRTRALRAGVLVSMGRLTEALEAGLPGFVTTRALEAAVRSDGSEALAHHSLATAQQIERGQAPVPKTAAWRFYYTGYAMLMDLVEAVRWLERGWEQGERWEVLAQRAYPTPYTDAVRAHPAYRQFEASHIGGSTGCPGPQRPAFVDARSYLRRSADPSAKLAILPFESLVSGQDDQELLDAVNWEVGAQLSRISDLRLLDDPGLQPALDSAGAGGPDAVLSGRVDKRDDRLRLALEVRSSDTTVWSAELQGHPAALPQLGRDAALAVAEALDLKVTPAERRRMEDPDYTDQSVRRLVMSTWNLPVFEPAANTRAIDVLGRAIALAPDSSPAHAAFAFQHVWKARLGDRDALQTAHAHVDRALALNQDSATANWVMGNLLGEQGRANEAIRWFRRSVELDPSNWSCACLEDLSTYLSHAGLFEESLEVAWRAFEIRPDAQSHWHVSIPLAHLGNAHRTRRWFELSTTLYPDNARSLASWMTFELTLGRTEVALELARDLSRRYAEVPEVSGAAAHVFMVAGDWPRARRWFDHAYRVMPNNLVGRVRGVRTSLAYLRGVMGDHDAAERLLSEAEEVLRGAIEDGYQFAFLWEEMAAISAFRGAGDDAYRWLSEAYERGFRDHRRVLTDPMYAGVIEDEQFAALLSRMEQDIESRTARLEAEGTTAPLDAMLERGSITAYL